MLPAPRLALWAKLGKAIYPECYHPLLFHLLDVAAVARELWDRVLRLPLKERFAAAVGLSMEDCRAWVAFWVGAHDVGKASPGFEQRDNAAVLEKHLRGKGFDFTVTRAPPHGTVSVPSLAECLHGWKVPEKTTTRIAVAVGGHHGIFPSSGWQDLGAFALGNERWAEARRDLLWWLANVLEVSRDRPPTGGQAEDQSYLMILAGLTSVADWIGSNQAFFSPKGNAANYLDDSEARVRSYLGHAGKQAEQALAQLGWVRGPVVSEKQPAFLDLFRYLKLPSVRPLQEAAARWAAELTGPALVLVEAPMGDGKTEAALCLADAWERRGGQGMYVALPTMATSNGMFGRLRTFLERTYPGRIQLHLLHGQALLSPAYQELVQQAKEHVFDAEVYDDDKAPGAVVADGWFAQDRKHSLLAPYGVGTIDQALLAVLQTKHGFVRLFGLAGKTVILDEVHAYDVYMSTLLERLLRWLAALGCPVILLSATLPRQKRDELLAAYSGALPQLGGEDKPYPCLTCVRPGGAPLVEHFTSPEKRLRLCWQDDELPPLANRLAEALQGGGCVAVIRNTVGLAQETYCELKQRLPADVEVELFHARFPFAWRQKIEQRVLQRYGKEGPRPAKAVLVATQVVEQSLDLDFDLLITDLAPVDLVLQRAGRVWRHQRDRRTDLPEATVWLLRPAAEADGVPDFGVSQVVYARFILLRSYLTLLGRNEVTLPGDMEKLIEAVYGNDAVNVPPELAWAAALAEAEKDMRTEQKEHRKAARTFLIELPVDEDEILYRFNQELEEDNPDIPKDRQAFTRLTEPNVALVFLYEIEGKPYLDPAGQRPVNLGSPPTLERARDFLNNAVSISHKDCVWHYVKRDPPKEWEKSGLLRFHRVVRVSREGEALKGEYPLELHPELGVVWIRQEERNT